MKNFMKNTILLLISIIIIFIIIYNIFFNKEKEGFSLNDIDDMFDDVKKVTKTVDDIPKEIKNIDKKLSKQVSDMGKEIEKNTINMLTNKLGSVFKQIGDIINAGLIQPILALFNGIGNIFVQIFNILKEITNKIISLPNCIFTYAIKETIDTFNYLYRKIIPKFLRNIFSFIYKYTFRYLFDFIGYITGYTASVQKCYSFNVSSEIDKINSSLNNIESSFKNDFGHLDFSKIKI